MSKLTYKDAGVDIDAGEELVNRIRPLSARTRTPEVLGGLGGFAGLCRLPEGLVDPVLVSGTDGVGTKLKIAFEVGQHDTVGIDLVAMCVNDIITCGARPLFFLDYFATGRLDVDVAEQVVSGIARGCEYAGCALLGGETAELPGMYAEGEYDLAGFAVGVVSRSDLLDGSSIAEGDTVIGIASNGLHSNGYSLARKALVEHAGIKLDETVDSLDHPLGRVLLRPTRIYARAVRQTLATGGVRGMCHITGGGLVGNIPRILPDGLGVELWADAWQRPSIFHLIAERGNVSESEMRRTFNLGLGYVVICGAANATSVLAAIQDAGETAMAVGEVIRVSADEDRVTFQ